MNLRVLIATLCLAVVSPAVAEVTISLDDQTNLGITIYNDNLALVRDSRTISVPKGRSTLAFIDVSAQIQAETALLEGNDFEVLEQNFDFDLLTPSKLLEKAVGQTVRLYRENPATGAETVETATILSNNGGTILQIGDRIEVIVDMASLPGRIVFEQIPDNLRARPTLSMEVLSEKKDKQDVTLNYLTGGLGWKADYVAYLNEAEDELALQGWVTLTNNSGTSFNDAQVQLIAGEVNRVVPHAQGRIRRQDSVMFSMDKAREVAEEQLSEYHLYSLPNRTTLANNQTKQVRFIEMPAVKARTLLELRGHQWYYRSRVKSAEPVKAKSYIVVENQESHGLGKPLPKGIVRIYQADKKGTAQFIGEDRITHTARAGTLRMLMGDSFDVSGTRKQTAYSSSTRVIEGAKLTDYRTGFEILVKNGKSKPVQVRVVEPLPGNWRITAENIAHTKEDAFTAVWLVDVPAEGETKLTFSVLTQESQ